MNYMTKNGIITGVQFIHIPLIEISHERNRSLLPLIMFLDVINVRD